MVGATVVLTGEEAVSTKINKHTMIITLTENIHT